MRIWSIHPKYLDSKGLVALWRETLLAKHVLEGKTKGYKNHPQLTRFKESEEPLARLNQYLATVWSEAVDRGYHFDKEKFNLDYIPEKIPVTDGQLAYETKHLLKKLKTRDPQRFSQLSKTEMLDVHPIFEVRKGEIEEWEKKEDLQVMATGSNSI